MKQAILSVFISITSTVALASTLVIQWEAPSGSKYAYYLDTGSARQMKTTIGDLVTAKVEVMDAQGVLVTEGNVVASGCNLEVPEGQSGLLDDDNALIPGTTLAHWSMVDFKAGSTKIAVILAGHTCLAALANSAL